MPEWSLRPPTFQAYVLLPDPPLSLRVTLWRLAGTSYEMPQKIAYSKQREGNSFFLPLFLKI